MANESQKLVVKQLLIKLFRLRMEPGQIENDAPLFGDGLALDSIDAIELVTGIEQELGVQIEGEEQSREVFQSVDTLTDFLAEQGALG